MSPSQDFISPNLIRQQFSKAMSAMYQAEVPLYSELMQLVSDVNAQVLSQDPTIKAQLTATGELERLDIERHGAIRLGLPSELATMRRLFAVMGMSPVGYYDLVPSGVPVHSTAFRATKAADLHISPFRVFTSLLRLELIDDDALRSQATSVLENRQIFTPRVLALIDQHEQQGGLSADDAAEFVQEALETFRWHESSPISHDLYQKLHDKHRLIADVVGFRGPHINHLTPRTLDIDAVQTGMPTRGITPKAVIEGPPRRDCPILLRQTSFKALQESVKFQNDTAGHHTARFGEIEQRGVALTPKGRQLYDTLLAEAREKLGAAPEEHNASDYMQQLAACFAKFPDDYRQMHDADLAYFYCQVAEKTIAQALQAVIGDKPISQADLPTLIDNGLVRIEPIVYEDFLPVSAAGIFQSNLGENGTADYSQASNQALFEKDLGAHVIDENQLYADTQAQSIKECLTKLQTLQQA